METTPSDIRSEAAAAALDPSRPVPPTAAASGTVSTGDIDGTSSASSNIMSDEKMMAAKERFYDLIDEKDDSNKRFLGDTIKYVNE